MPARQPKKMWPYACHNWLPYSPNPRLSARFAARPPRNGDQCLHPPNIGIICRLEVYRISRLYRATPRHWAKGSNGVHSLKDLYTCARSLSSPLLPAFSLSRPASRKLPLRKPPPKLRLKPPLTLRLRLLTLRLKPRPRPLTLRKLRRCNLRLTAKKNWGAQGNLGALFLCPRHCGQGQCEMRRNEGTLD